MPDGAGTRARIGVLTPHMDAVPESECMAMAPAGVSVHAARVPLGMVGPDGEIIPRVDAEVAKAFAAPPAVDEAAALLAAVSPGAILYAFTSSSYILGRAGDAELRARLERRTRGVPVVVQASALAAGLRAVGAEKVYLAHPPWFSHDLDALGAGYFRDHGLDVLGHAPAALRSDYGDIPPGRIVDWLVARAPDAAQAVAIGGGGFRAIAAVREAERRLSRPVLTANQAGFWLALRLAGVQDRLPGYGALFDAQAGGR